MNYEKYIGLPYKDNGRDTSGIDCWGLVRLFYKQEYNIDLPSYTAEYDGPHDVTLADLIATQREGSWKRLEAPVPGCAVLFNILGEPVHIGVYLGEGKFLHSRDGLDTVVESLDSFKWSKRVEGFYEYAAKPAVTITGCPHPLKSGVQVDWTVAGTTVQQCVDFINAKYQVSERLASHVVIMLNGEVLPREQWDTTTLQETDSVVYRVVPKGKNALRMLLTVAVMIVSQGVFTALGGSAAGATFGTKLLAGVAAGATAMAGMALINAIVPIRPPTDPGQAKGLNLFSGASNQANKFGAIPVVLGQVRMTAMLGATPYIEAETDTTFLNLMLVWGFGPLNISDVCVGATPLHQLYGTRSGEEGIKPPEAVHFSGLPGETSDAVDSKYPGDIEQKIVQVQLTNNQIPATEGGTPDGIIPHTEYFVNPCEEIHLVFNFPEGMRAIDTGSGDIKQAVVELKVELLPEGGNWQTVAPYVANSYNASGAASIALEKVFALPQYKIEYNDTSQDVLLRKKIAVTVAPGGGIEIFEGAGYDLAGGISSTLEAAYKAGNYSSLLGTNNSYYIDPIIPPDYVKIHEVIIAPTGLGGPVLSNTSYLGSLPGSSGLGLTITNEISSDGPQESVITGVKLVVQGGMLPNTGQPAPGTDTILTSRDFSGVSVAPEPAGNTTGFGDIFITSNSTTLSISSSVSFPHTGKYKIAAAMNGYGSVTIDGVPVLELAAPGVQQITGEMLVEVELTAGTHSVGLQVTSEVSAVAGLLITFTTAVGTNKPSTTETILVYGKDRFNKRKDAFNDVHVIKNLPRSRYAVRISRLTPSDSDSVDKKTRYYYTSVLYSVIGYDYHQDDGSVKKIVTDPPGTAIARSYIRVQSSSKVNGTVDGINALVQSVCWDWDHTTSSWQFRATNNPASLFLHVLLHSANAYRIQANPTEIFAKIKLDDFIDWHNFCRTGGTFGVPLTYNNVITSTSSVMDVLRDIAAAGKASPAFVDGKWTIVIDRPRTTVVQHFTPNNSWGFESTKIIPRIPDAFRVTYINAAKAFQPDEFFVYNTGKNSSNAYVFEELQLPGVTNYRQAKHLAQWHMAQLRLRPETYTLNVDFEYLVCTRGDLVRVAHDVPLWGTGSGRINSCQVGSSTVVLNDEVYVETGKTYVMRARTETGASITINLASIAQTGYTSSITLARAITSGDGIKIGDLVMVGEVSKESQQLIVLAVEPGDSTSAKLTLTDYSPDLYTTNLDTGYPAYNPNITTKNSDVVQNAITEAPQITNVVSDAPLSEEVSRGVYQNVLVIAFASSSTIGKNATRIQVQVVGAAELFNANSLQESVIIPKEQASVRILGLKTGAQYKIRARYLNATASIVGPWSSTKLVANVGKDTNYYVVPTVSLDLDTTYIIASPAQDLAKPSDFKHYEFRLYKDTGTEDFWDLDPVANGILVSYSLYEARFNLLDVPVPRISTEGITYRVACRAVDSAGNYSPISALGTIVVATIK